MPNGNYNSTGIALETQHFHFLCAAVKQHDVEVCLMHRKLPKNVCLLLKTNQFIRQRQQWLWRRGAELLVSGHHVLGGEKKIRPSRSRPPTLCFYSLMRDGRKKSPRFLAVLGPHLASRGAGRSPGALRPGGHITLHLFCFSCSSLAPAGGTADEPARRSDPRIRFHPGPSQAG